MLLLQITIFYVLFRGYSNGLRQWVHELRESRDELSVNVLDLYTFSGGIRYWPMETRGIFGMILAVSVRVIFKI